MYLGLQHGSNTIVFEGTGKNSAIEGTRWIPAISSDDVDEVTETLVIVASGTGATLIALKDTIEQFFALAHSRRHKVMGTRTYIRSQLSGASEVSRSEILEGYVNWSGQKPTYYQANAHAELLLTLTRKNYWEGETLRTLPLTNRYGTGNTSGLTIDNIYSASKDNFVKINYNDILSELRTPAVITIVNTYNSANRNDRFWITQNVESNPFTLNPIIEGEASETGNLNFTSVADATRSGGYYGQWTWSGGNTAAGLLAAIYTIPSANLQKYAGNFVKLMMTIPSVSSNVYVKFALLFEVTTIWEGSWVPVSGGQEVFEISSLQLPPFLYEDSSLLPYPLKLYMYVRDDDGTSKTLQVDFFYITPIDGWRSLRSKGYGQGYNVSLIDDGIHNTVYTTGWATSGIVGNYIGLGEPIMLMPNRNQSLSFIWDATGGHLPARTATVKVQYRTRRRGL